MSDSIYDDLTGVGNYHLIPTCFNQYAGNQSRFGMILIDVDGLIYFNDRYGHNEGDKKLKEIANIISGILPNCAEIFRSGGDEFVVFVSDLKMAEVLSLAMKICEEVKQQFSHLPPLRRCFTMHDLSSLEVHLPLTVSCGVAFYPEHGVNYATLYQAADEAALRAGKHLYGGVVGVVMNLNHSCYLPSDSKPES